MKRILIGSLFFIVTSPGAFLANQARAAECTRTCVEVRREGGDLVISAHRDPVKRKVLPQLSPTPTPTRSPIATTRKSTERSQHKRARPSLSDQIREALPAGSFTLLPRTGALIYEPLLIHAHGCANIVKTLPILDTSISLMLDPALYWDWGDGSMEVWRGNAIRGAHIYHRPGRYRILMSCQWGGRFRTPDTPWLPIPDGIVSTSTSLVTLSRAQIFFTD